MPKWTVITAIICIAALVGIALLKGQNGTLLAIGISAITGLGGWALPAPRRQK